jgi:hypothetical protein
LRLEASAVNTYGAAPELDWADNLPEAAVWAQRIAFDPPWQLRVASWLWSFICRVAALFGR